MALDPKVFIQNIISGAYESNKLFSKFNRSYDGLITNAWAKSVDIPINPTLVASSAAVAVGSSDRKRGSDMTTVNVPLSPIILPIAATMEDMMATNQQLLDQLSKDALAALEQELDRLALVAAHASLPGGNIDTVTGAGAISNKDLAKGKKFLMTNKRYAHGQVFGIVDINISDEFDAVPKIASASGYNRDLLEQGVALVDGVYYIKSALLPTVSGKYGITYISAPYLAVILKGTMDRNEVYDAATASKIVDYVSYAGCKRTVDNGVFRLQYQ